MVTELDRSCLAILPRISSAALRVWVTHRIRRIGIAATNVQSFGGQRLGLARPGPRDHDRWTVDRPYRRFLLGVEVSG